MNGIRIAIDYTGTYKVNQVTERYTYKYFEEQTGPNIKVLYQSAYQICHVYIKENTVLNALQKLNGKLATNQVFLDNNNILIPAKYHRSIRRQIKFNDRFNCHGFTFLDSHFWLHLNNETVETIIKENKYQVCNRDKLVNNGICLYYNNEGRLIHSAKNVNGNILSKFGINDLITTGEEEILTRYKKVDSSRTVYLNPSE